MATLGDATRLVNRARSSPGVSEDAHNKADRLSRQVDDLIKGELGDLDYMTAFRHLLEGEPEKLYGELVFLLEN